MDPQKFDARGQSKSPDASWNKKPDLMALIEQTTIVHSADLARAGRYSEAEASLRDALSNREATPALLDLLARIHAQQGHWKEAEESWIKAQKLNPAGKTYAAGLKRISQAKKQRISRVAIFATGALLILLACVASGLFLFPPSHPTSIIIPVEIIIPTLTQTPASTRTPSPTPTFSPSSTPIILPTSVIFTCTVTTGKSDGKLNVREGPDIYFRAIGWLAEGEEVVVSGDLNFQKMTGWTFITQQPDLKGWVKSMYCK